MILFNRKFNLIVDNRYMKVFKSKTDLTKWLGKLDKKYPNEYKRNFWVAGDVLITCPYYLNGDSNWTKYEDKYGYIVEVEKLI